MGPPESPGNQSSGLHRAQDHDDSCAAPWQRCRASPHALDHDTIGHMATTPPHFSDVLAAAIRRVRSPVMVGLDPQFEQLPGTLQHAGHDLTARAQACERFCKEVIDVVGALAAAVKPQVACFERFGTAGMAALKAVIDHAHAAGLLVVADGKRNDIGHTAAAYAAAWLGRESAWGADALTVNPYLGEESLQPFVEVAVQQGAGIFVLVKTSNPGGGQFQDLQAEARPVYRHVAEVVERLAARTASPAGYGLVGAVAGATWPAQLAELRVAMPHAWLLVPGYGGQGAGAADVAAAFDEQGLGALINNARGLIYAFQRQPYAGRYGPARWQQAVEAATLEMMAALRAETAAGRL